MGDTKKQRPKYSRPSHPWQKERIEEERVLLKEYGLANKKELWKSSSLLKSATRQAKTLIPLRTEQARKEEDALLKKLMKLGLLPTDAKMEDILNLSQKAILDRRLQTMVFRKGFARSVSQARQFVVHGHITVNGKKISSPAYVVGVAEENAIAYSPSSTLADEAHPERNLVQAKPKDEKKEETAEAKE